MRPSKVSRPFMPGYGTLGPADGTGLLPWAWAEERLAQSKEYWLATVTAAGRPHVMPVWAVLFDDQLWFSSSKGSRKARNLLAHPECSLATADPNEPVVAEGRAELVTERASLERLLRAENEKYATSYGMDMVDPDTNCCFAMSPERVFALASTDFTGSPTRWTFSS
jgi:general stress protein 26